MTAALSRTGKIIKSAAVAYGKSWLFLLWSVSCLIVGAYLMHQADTEVVFHLLRAKGLL